MDNDNFVKLIDAALTPLFDKARQADELSFLFAILGINSGEEDAGWQPINETLALTNDLVGLINSPLRTHTRSRLALFLYCHLTEADFIYHCIFNLLLTVEREPPKIFNFLDLYKHGIPPSFSAKLKEINAKAEKHGFSSIPLIFNEIIHPHIRNAFFHSDYALYQSELRLKHRVPQHAKIPLDDVMELTQRTVTFLHEFMARIQRARHSFSEGYEIRGRRSPDGRNLTSVKVSVGEDGGANGFSTTDPLPIW